MTSRRIPRWPAVWFPAALATVAGALGVAWLAALPSAAAYADVPDCSRGAPNVSPDTSSRLGHAPYSCEHGVIQNVSLTRGLRQATWHLGIASNGSLRDAEVNVNGYSVLDQFAYGDDVTVTVYLGRITYILAPSGAYETTANPSWIADQWRNTALFMLALALLLAAVLQVWLWRLRRQGVHLTGGWLPGRRRRASGGP
jgi:hypothetical protein